ncbi:hypothetical protein QCA50_012543 [Cerrena zonata]|uniref:Uncharacterized protein n=1 Tax=Cerrena zonata TaxID=2478898 RepID=A0AAW0G1F9_9APHY
MQTLPLRKVFFQILEGAHYGDLYSHVTRGPALNSPPSSSLAIDNFRCTARSDNLDNINNADVTRRSHEHTDALLEAFNLKELWDDYGIVGDVVPFTVAFPRADIHELLSPDLLHQVIKGTFKDHLVTWVEEYLDLVHGPTHAAQILADIDRRISAAPSFPGLRRFPEGRGFNQWTGDDSKALMKVYLPAIASYIPAQMTRTLSAFMDFCYLVRRSVITEDTLLEIHQALANFHEERTIFEQTGVRVGGISLPRQHSLKHYEQLIRSFGAPNGLCSLITESKHIAAVKKPWRRSSRFEALGQMLVTNQRLDKLAAARVDFTCRNMINTTTLPMPSPSQSKTTDDSDDPIVEGERVLGEVKLAKCASRGVPRNTEELAAFIGVPQLPSLIRRFLFDQVSEGDVDPMSVALETCPEAPRRIFMYPSAVATFYAPSDLSGAGGMHRERIRAVASWRKGPPRYDCAFLEKDTELPGFRGLHAVRVLLFFKFRLDRTEFPCALVSWFSPISDDPCEDTGMWIIEPDLDEHGERMMSVIHLDCILRGAHLIGVAGKDKIPRKLQYSDSLDAFKAFYVNKYIDHHAHEIAF